MKNPRAYDVLGNIAIVNFSKESNLKNKKRFAQKLLKSNKSIKTVLEKTGKIKGRLRKPELKYLAGDKSKEVLYKENGCIFRFNVETTYFSPRLSNERKEIASKIKGSDKVLVMFAGVAPFSIVIAKKSGAKVISNEINREATKYAKLNIELNKVKDRVEIVGGDVRKLSFPPPAQNLPPPKVRGIYNKVVNQKTKSVSDLNKFRAQRGKIPKFDVIVMPRPQLKDSFLDIAFKFSKKGTRIYYYDFCGVDEVDEVVEKIKSEASRARKKIKILKKKKAGEIAPYRVRVRVDIAIL